MPLLDVRDLCVDYLDEDGRPLRALESVSFTLERGRSLALVGESGCGKTTAMLALLRLLPQAGRITSGQIIYNGTDLLRLSEHEMRAYRWRRIALVFQGAMNALNPVRRIGDQIAEAIIRHEQVSRRDAHQRAAALLSRVGILPLRARDYPHEFSGGMRQRAMIAMALACRPDILIADEPTTALDVMIQAQILDLLQELQAEMNLALVLVTHDLGVVAELCDDVLIMYGGQVAEMGDVDRIFNRPLHPYTQGLLRAFPDPDRPREAIQAIPGHPPPLNALPPGCRFEPRCPRRSARCAQSAPPLENYNSSHQAACFHIDPKDSA